jgi:hypothetical protein
MGHQALDKVNIHSKPYTFLHKRGQLSELYTISRKSSRRKETIVYNEVGTLLQHGYNYLRYKKVEFLKFYFKLLNFITLKIFHRLYFVHTEES